MTALAQVEKTPTKTSLKGIQKAAALLADGDEQCGGLLDALQRGLGDRGLIGGGESGHLTSPPPSTP